MPAKRAQPKPKPKKEEAEVLRDFLAIGRNILAHRIAAGLSQHTLAILIGYSGKDTSSVISRFENGARQPRISTVKKLAEVFGVRVSELIS